MSTQLQMFGAGPGASAIVTAAPSTTIDPRPVSQYRNELWRRVGREDGALVVFVMLNPSTADDTTDDPTVRRCIGFAKSAGVGAGMMLITNLFTYRATDPADLSRAAMAGVDVVGQADAVIDTALDLFPALIIAAWGAHRVRGPAGKYDGRALDVTNRINRAGFDLACLGMTAAGQPRHPLYVRADQIWTLYSPKLRQVQP